MTVLYGSPYFPGLSCLLVNTFPPRPGHASLSLSRSLIIRVALVALIVVGITLTVSAMQQRNSTAEFTLYPLKHIGADEARRMVRDLLGDEAKNTRIVADTAEEKLLVSGSKESLKVISSLLDRIDAAPLRQVEKQVEIYQVPKPAEVAGQLRAQFGNTVTVTESVGTGSVVVRADRQTQSRIRSQLQTSQASRPQNPRNAASAPFGPARTPGDAARTPKSARVQFRVRDAAGMEGALSRVLEERLRSDAAGNRTFTTADGRSVRLAFQGSECRLVGATSLVDQFVTLMSRLDRSGKNETNRTRFIRTRNTSPEVVRRVVQQLRAAKSQAEPSQYPPQGSVMPTAVIQLASYQRSNQRPQLRRPASDLEIEALPDLDVIVLRGRDPDVEELTKIIQEIERIAETTAPEIEIYHLQHVRGTAVDTLVDQVLDDLTGTLQGRVTVTPLVKPNALLLIGWGEAVNSVKRLIEKLDRPVAPETQLQIFPLKYAAAGQLQTTIQLFLQNRGGLGPDAVVTFDNRTNSLIVNAAPRDMQEVKALISRLDTAESASVNRGRMIKLKNSLATDISTTVQAAITAARGGGSGGRSAVLEMLLDGPDGERMLKSGLLDDVRVTADGRTNTLFLTGPPESVKLIEAMIGQLDQNAASSAKLKVFPVENSDAGEMVLVLRTLFPAATTGSTVPQLASTAGESSLIPVRFSVDARTNTIIATGSEGDLEVVEALIRRLDQDGAKDRVNKVFRLKNAPALDVAQAVNEFLRSERIVQQAAPGRQNAFQQIESEVVVVPEPVGNSLIISATPRFYDEIIELVEELDEQPPQVLIQVVLAEVELNNQHEFGVELGLQDSLLFDRGLLGDLLTTTSTTATSTAAGVVTETAEIIQAASLTPGFDFNNNPLGNSGSTQSIGTAANVAGQALSHFSLGRVNSDLGYGGLVLSASSENVSILIRALNQSGRFEVLSRPQIMTLDNQPASILVGQRVPRVVGTSINQIGQVNSIELEDVGLILGVTPRISPDGMVVMEVDAEKSELGRTDDGIPVSVSADGTVVRSPRVNITRAQTTVSAASGQTIVIGGLITNEDRSITRRVPYLAEIPLLGELFKYDSSDNRRKELLIILTPRVVRNRAEAEHIKQLEMARISWSSSDAFDWTCGEAEGVLSGAIDDSGVPVIYPDDTPGLEWTPGSNSNTVPADPSPFGLDVEASDFEPIQQMSHTREVKLPTVDAKKKSRRPGLLWPFRRGGRGK
ncbi:MAG: secretin N-terminal domain-containing protein [Planctomycetaceae bacterium]